MRSRVAGEADPARAIQLNLLGGFELIVNGQVMAVPMPAQRLLVLLAIHDRPLLRPYIAGLLWPDTRRERAMANLRSALRQCERSLVQRSKERLQLAAGVAVDYRQSLSVGHRLLVGQGFDNDIDPTVELLDSGLLPDWAEDWIETCRSTHHQLRLHALEALAEHLLVEGRVSHAVEVSLVAVNAEPLRESARLTLIRALIAEGNRAQAIRHYHEFSRYIRAELSIAPSFDLRELLEPENH